MRYAKRVRELSPALFGMLLLLLGLLLDSCRGRTTDTVEADGDTVTVEIPVPGSESDTASVAADTM